MYELMKDLDYTNMGSAFLSAIAHMPSVQESGLLPSIMGRALWLRDHRPEHLIPSPRIKAPPDGAPFSYRFTAQFSKEAIAALEEKGEPAKVPLGMVHGLPCRLELTRFEPAHTDIRFYLNVASDMLEWEVPYIHEHRAWFDFSIGGGTFGALGIDKFGPCGARVSAHDAILGCGGDDLVVDDSGKLQVALELTIDPKYRC